MKILSLFIVLFSLILGGSWLAPFRYFKSLKNDVLPTLPQPDATLATSSGTISGRVFVAQSSGFRAAAPRGLYGRGVSRLANNPTVDKRAVVFINKAYGRFYPPQSRPVMRQKNVTIVPRVLPVLEGTTVDFPNEDEIYHNIFSLSSTKTFDLGRYAKGRSKSVTFDKVGTVKVFCDIHSQMSGTVLVLQNPYFTVADESGRYDLSGIPAGTYELSAWHEDSGLRTRSVTVGDGDRVSVDFSF